MFFLTEDRRKMMKDIVFFTKWSSQASFMGAYYDRNSYITEDPQDTFVVYALLADHNSGAVVIGSDQTL